MYVTHDARTCQGAKCLCVRVCVCVDSICSIYYLWYVCVHVHMLCVVLVLVCTPVY